MIDTARVRCIRRGGIRLHQRIDDLKRLTHKLDNEKKRYFMDLYLSKLGRSFTLSQQLAFKLYALKTKLKGYKRHIHRKLCQ
jgi:hypothetical protein